MMVRHPFTICTSRHLRVLAQPNGEMVRRDNQQAYSAWHLRCDGRLVMQSLPQPSIHDEVHLYGTTSTRVFVRNAHIPNSPLSPAEWLGAVVTHSAPCRS